MKRPVISALILGAALAGTPAALAQTVTESSCHIVTNDGENPTPLVGVSVMERAAQPGMFSLRLPSDMEVDALLCFRSSAIPGPDDWEVVAAGFPLYLTESRASGDVTTLLEITDDQFRVRIIDGTLTSAERQAVAARLESYYAVVNSGM
ncbi:hypothetical protein [Hyphobacterium marinum]|uniref:Uncharacterized protein n=1 Tax=Hyphobacterium marinum TaxID=3116574 RepID=A0ABU7LVA0_9PROT|nr:hypothetical protein [Hyphobacterium sp. Y6023]MEE2565478.1 hypothetical protein [Hyphobacterium sp. Y6023]